MEDRSVAQEDFFESGLNPKQWEALNLVAMGNTDKAVAESIGVRRETVTRWRLSNPKFKAELNKVRWEIRGSMFWGMQDLIAECIATIREAVRSGDSRLASSVVQQWIKSGALVLPTPGSTDALQIAVADAKAWASQQGKFLEMLGADEGKGPQASRDAADKEMAEAKLEQMDAQWGGILSLGGLAF